MKRNFCKLPGGTRLKYRNPEPMGTKLTVDDARQSLTAHVAAKGAEIHSKYGPSIGWNELLRILEDRTACRYPCEVVFASEPLQPGEFAVPVSKGQRPEDGFTIFVHPHFEAQPERVVYLVLYQLVPVNYGEFVSAGDAETFGASALGISNDEYYGILCEMADQIGGAQEAGIGECSESGCHCH